MELVPELLEADVEWERGAESLLADSQVVLPAFSSPGRGARHEIEKPQRRCVRELNLTLVIAGWFGEGKCLPNSEVSLSAMQRICC